MTDRLRQTLCDLVAAHGPALADDPRRCGELLRAAAPDDGAGVGALLAALEARVPARLALLTEPLALAPVTSGLVRRLVEEQGLGEEAARWAVGSWAAALGKGDGDAPAPPVGYEHLAAPPRRRRWLLGAALAALVALAAVGAWKWSGERSEVRRLVVANDSAYALDVARDGRTLLAAYASNSLRLWDVSTGAELRRFDGHPQPPGSVAVPPDKAPGDKQPVWEGSQPPVCVALSPDGRLALSCGGNVLQKGKHLVPVDCAVRVWDVETGQERHPLVEPPVSPWCVAFAPDGKRALVCTGGWDTKGTDYVKAKDNKPVPIDCLVRVYDLDSGRELCKMEGHKEPVFRAAFTPDGGRVVSAGFDGALKLWDARTGRELRGADLGREVRVTCLAVSPDGTRLLTGDTHSHLRLWNLDDLSELVGWTAHSEWVRGVAFSPDGRRALSGGDDYAVRLWDVADPEHVHEVRHFVGHTSYVTPVAFLPDGREAVSGSSDGTIRIWRLPR